MITFMTVLLAAAAHGPDVAKAEKLYVKAKYDAALTALGSSCVGAANGARCEQLRASVLMALGREKEARAAFERQIIASPEASVANDLPPKLKTLFEAAQRAVGNARNAVIEPVDIPTLDTPQPLVINLPAEVTATRVTVYLSPTGRNLYMPVDMKSEGGAWKASYKGAAAEAGTDYYVSFVLDDTAEVTSGSREIPRHFKVMVAEVINAAKAGEGGATDAMPKTKKDEKGGGIGEWFSSLPTWERWTILGVGGAVVTGAVVGTVIATTSGGGGNGSVAVNVKVQ